MYVEKTDEKIESDEEKAKRTEFFKETGKEVTEDPEFQKYQTRHVKGKMAHDK